MIKINANVHGRKKQQYPVIQLEKKIMHIFGRPECKADEDKINVYFLTSVKKSFRCLCIPNRSITMTGVSNHAV